MPFSINDFKAIINSNTYGGPSRTNLFEVIITGGSSNYVSQKDLTAFCSVVTIPSIGVDVFNYKSNNFGLHQEMPIDISKDHLDGVFMLDSNHLIMSYFHEWMQSVVNYSTKGGIFSEVNGSLPYEIGYKDEYSKTMTIRHYTTDNYDAYYEIVFKGVYPIDIGKINLTWSSLNEVATLPIKFSYSSMSFSAEAIGTNSTYSGRGNGLLELINYVGNSIQAVAQGVSILPRTVQDAVNVYTAVNRTNNVLKNTLRKF